MPNAPHLGPSPCCPNAMASMPPRNPCTRGSAEVSTQTRPSLSITSAMSHRSPLGDSQAIWSGPIPTVTGSTSPVPSHEPEQEREHGGTRNDRAHGVGLRFCGNAEDAEKSGSVPAALLGGVPPCNLASWYLVRTRRPQPKLLRNAIPECYRGRPLAGAGPAPWTSPTPTWRKSCRTRVHQETCPLAEQGRGTHGWNVGTSTAIRP